MVQTLVVYADFMPYEAAAAAIVSLASNVKCISLTINEAKDHRRVSNIIRERWTCDEEDFCVLFLGTYWKEETIACVNEYASVSIYDYGHPRDEVKDTPGILRFFGAQQEKGLASFALHYLEENKLMDPSPLTMIRNFSKDAIRLIDDRTFNRNTLETQMFFSGMYNIGSQDTGLVDKFLSLFHGELNFVEVMKLGKTVTEIQINMSLARAQNASRKIKLSDGTECAVACAPDLVNLTNDKLREVYGTPVTMTMALNFKGSTTISFSIRSYDKKIDAGALARKLLDENGKLLGDGNREAGGARRSFEIDIPF